MEGREREERGGRERRRDIEGEKESRKGGRRERER